MKRNLLPPIAFFSFIIPFVILVVIVVVSSRLILALKDSELQAAQAVDMWNRMNAKISRMYSFDLSFDERLLVEQTRGPRRFIVQYQEAYLERFDALINDLRDQAPRGLWGAKTCERLENALRVWRYTRQRIKKSLKLYQEFLLTNIGRRLLKTSYVETIDMLIWGKHLAEPKSAELLLFYRMQDSLSDLDVSGDVFSSLLDEISLEIQARSRFLIRAITGFSFFLAVLIISLAYAYFVRAEDALKESEDRFRSLVETTSDWIWEVNKEARYIYAGPKIKELLGYEPREMIGKTPFDLMPVGERERVWKIFEFYASMGQPFFYLENIGLRKDGRQVLLETSGVPVFDKAGKVKGYRGIDRDITERKKAQQKEKELDIVRAVAEVEKKKAAELSRAYRAIKEAQEKLIRSEKLAILGELAGTIAHELRNPLGSIRNTVYFLKSKCHYDQVDEKVGKHWEILENEVSIADKIISDVLTFARVKAPLLELVDLAGLIEEILRHLRVPGNVEVQLALGEKREPLYIDPNQIRMVLMNLFLNALQAMPEGGVLKIACRDEQKQVVLSVSDTGAGIPTGQARKIFEPLFSTKIKGTGLGLAICQSIVESHGGKIAVRSAPGQGAKFTVTLPRRKEG